MTARPSASSLREYLTGHSITLFDVGSRGSTHPRWGGFSDCLTVVGFEPDRSECRRLNELSTGERKPHHPFALSDGSGPAPFYHTLDPGCSSLLKPNESFVSRFEFGKFMRIVKTSEVETTTLDDFAMQHQIFPDILKIDTQGSELSVLQGASQTLSNVCIVDVEVEFAYLYMDQALFPEVDTFLRANGFALLGLRRSYWRTLGGAHSRDPSGGQLVHADALYYREGLLQDNESESGKLMALLIGLSAYKQYDIVEACLNTHEAFQNLSRVAIADLSRQLIPRFSAGQVLLRLGCSVVSYSRLRELAVLGRQVPAYDWHDPDYF